MKSQYESTSAVSNKPKTTFESILGTATWELLNGVIASLLILIPIQLEVIQKQIDQLLTDNAYQITWSLVIGYMIYRALTITTKKLNTDKVDPINFIKTIFK